MSPTTWRARRPRSARPGFRALSLIASLAASSLLAGCGDAPRAPALARADAAPLAALARQVAGEGPCAARRDIRLLERRATALVRGGRVPTALERPLLAGVSALAAENPPCLPAVPAAAATPPPPTPTAPVAPEPPPGHRGGDGQQGDHGQPHGHGHADGPG